MTKHSTTALPAGPGFSPGLAAGVFVFLLCWSLTASATEWLVQPGRGTLQLAIEAASPGDKLRLGAGRYLGSIDIDRSLSLSGNGDSIVDGEGSGHVIRISAPDVLVEDLRIENSGEVAEDENSGIFITDKGDRAVVRNNRLQNNLIGIYLKGPDSAIVRNNHIRGSQFHRMNDRGNGIYLWDTPGSVIEDNIIQFGRDGIFVNGSRDNVFSGNRMSDLRFAVHYMYAHDSVVSNNISINNHVGFAIMFSDRIEAKNNLSSGDSQRGLFFNAANYSSITGNRVVGAEKCVFIYNANHNRVADNSFEACQIGIHFTAGSENNQIYSNAFIDNRTQVKYVGTRYIEWSKNGRGNYWSDNPAFDLDANGIADQIYKPNDLVDQIVWRHPLARFLLNSPSVQLLKWIQSAFPGLHPGGVTDSRPLMQPSNNLPDPQGDRFDSAYLADAREAIR